MKVSLRDHETAELILRGDQQDAIRAMLKDRSYVLIESPHEWKLWGVIDCCSINCGIRDLNSKTPIVKCKYCLSLDHTGFNAEDFAYCAKDGQNMSSPPIDELLEFLADKELVLNNHYIDDMGDMETKIVRTFISDILMLRKHPEKIYRDMFYDVRIYATREGSNRFFADDVRNFDVNDKVLGSVREETQEYRYNLPEDFSVEFELKSETSEATYYLRCFHCKTDGRMGILCYRFSVLVLPEVKHEEETFLPDDREQITDVVNGINYKIESIHVNSEMVRNTDDLGAWFYLDLCQSD